MASELKPKMVIMIEETGEGWWWGTWVCDYPFWHSYPYATKRLAREAVRKFAKDKRTRSFDVEVRDA